MPSPDLFDLLDRFADAWNRHDLDALMSMMTDDCVFEASAGADVNGQRSEGQAAVRAAYAEPTQPVQWVRVTDLPDYVYFNHQAHVNAAVGCESCHGRVDQMVKVYQWAPLTMAWSRE